MSSPLIVVFVHGWSVTDTETYGGLPVRVRNEAKAHGLDIDVQQVFLSQYLSFHDEVALADVSRAFDTALHDAVPSLASSGHRIACITHSTGGPVVRDWWQRLYASQDRRCPMSHLIMLAPANFGSSLAQLGKGRLSRIKAAFSGVEPGQGILDWLELGSPEAWALNSDWIDNGQQALRKGGMFPFVMTGQTIDRKFYDHLNAYTGESGSDGVVRVAAANLNARRIELTQATPPKTLTKKVLKTYQPLQLTQVSSAPQTAMRIVSEASHSGSDLGIMRSVYRPAGHHRGREVTDAILRCLAVQTKADYDKLVTQLADETTSVQQHERLEIEKKLLRRDVTFIHDRYSMVIFRVTDDYGHAISDFDLILTAGKDNDPNHLPRGFFMDRQQNKRFKNTITYYFNYDVMAGSPALTGPDGNVVRPALAGASALGFRIQPRPDDGFVRYLPCQIKADQTLLRHTLAPNATTLIDIRLRRIVDDNVFRLRKMQGDNVDGSFKRVRPSRRIVD